VFAEAVGTAIQSQPSRHASCSVIAAIGSRTAL
jgi:hypothetical protein